MKVVAVADSRAVILLKIPFPRISLKMQRFPTHVSKWTWITMAWSNDEQSQHLCTETWVKMRSREANEKAC
jgi:hypothetical protein